MKSFLHVYKEKLHLLGDSLPPPTNVARKSVLLVPPIRIFVLSLILEVGSQYQLMRNKLPIYNLLVKLKYL